MFESPLVTASLLASSVYGLFVFLLAALVWFGFRNWHARANQLPT